MRAPVLPPPAQPKKRRRRKSFLLSFIGWGFGAFVLVFLAASGFAAWKVLEVSKDLPNYDSLAKYEPPVMTRVHAHDGSLIAEYARERRIFVPINTIPKGVIAAFLSAEDRRFYEHGGLDYWGILRASVDALESKFRGIDKRTQGASTITQQVAKNFLLTSDRTIERKIKEAILAIRIERAYTKDKILELYLNEIFLGLGSYGIAAASLTYFNKELKDLTIEEAAYLAALPKAPNNYHPIRQREKATDRRNWIIGQMADNGYITREEAEAAKKKPIEVANRQNVTQMFSAEYFAEEVRRSINAEYGEEKLYAGGLSVRTTLDPKLQQIARTALVNGLVAFDRKQGWRGPVAKLDVSGDWREGLLGVDMPNDIAPWRLGVVLSFDAGKAVVGLRQPRGANGKFPETSEGIHLTFDEVKWAKPGGGKVAKAVTDILNVGDVVYVAPKESKNTAGVWSLMQIPEVGGGLVAMDPHTGRVLAVSGGFSFAMSQFDRVIQAKRQPGSSFKPIVYSAAIDNGYKPTSIILDAPIEINQGPGQDIWKPENYENDKSYGPTTLRVGVEKSRNQMTVRLAQDLGMPLITEYARRFGVYDDLLPVLAMSLGAGETTLLRMATAYCMIANGGKQVRATLIDRIQDRWGHAVWRHDARACTACNADKWANQEEPDIPDDRKQIIDPHTSYQMISIMEGVIQRGTATTLKSLNRPIAGKTGTTNEEKDAWFLGFTPDLVVGVFIGYDTPKPMGKGNTGGHVAAPVFGEFMQAALGDSPPVPFRQPPGIKLVRVSIKSGMRAGPNDPNAITEAFKPYEEPDDAYSIIGFSNVGEEQPSASTPVNDAWRPPRPPGYSQPGKGLW